MRLLFLYTELAPYFLCCLENFIKKHDAKVALVHWKVNREAPFDFSFSGEITLFNRNDLNAKQLISVAKNFAPDAIYCSGWMDKDYLKVCRYFRKKIPVITGLDNQWKGNFAQRFASFISPFIIKKYFSHCWVPGETQKQYALRLGFSDEKIFTGFYSADNDFFRNLFLSFREGKKKNFPKRFLFAARYYAFKGITDLWKAFIRLQTEFPNDWELWCLGRGDVDPIIHHKIKHFGFVQPNEMGKYISETGVFILPSTFEPWGVAVHEFAAAGFPLVCSDEVGAAELFLKDGKNGFLFKSGNISELSNAMKKIISLSDDKLFAMGEVSAELAMQITPDTWADTLMSILKTSDKN